MSDKKATEMRPGWIGKGPAPAGASDMRSPKMQMDDWAEQDAKDLAAGPRAVEQPPQPPQAPPPPEAPMEPGMADKVLAVLRSTEPFKTIVNNLIANVPRADKALQGGVDGPAPAAPDPTVQALRNGPSASIPNQ